MKNKRLAAELLTEIREFLTAQGSMMIAVNDAEQCPLASYSPFVQVNDKLYILVSQLAKHTQALLTQHQASALLIADESKCEQIYARQRLQYEMSIQEIPRSDDLWEPVVAALTQRHGDIVSQLIQLSDFHLIEFTPLSGRFVKGFGRAYELDPGALVGDNVDHLSR